MSIEVERAREGGANVGVFVRNGMAYLTYNTRNPHRVRYYVKGSAEKTVDVRDTSDLTSFCIRESDHLFPSSQHR